MKTEKTIPCTGFEKTCDEQFAEAVATLNRVALERAAKAEAEKKSA